MQYLIGDNLKVVWAKSSTLSQAVLLQSKESTRFSPVDRNLYMKETDLA